MLTLLPPEGIKSSGKVGDLVNKFGDDSGISATESIDINDAIEGVESSGSKFNSKKKTLNRSESLKASKDRVRL